MADYIAVTSALRRAYDAQAEQRDKRPVAEWRQSFWSQFLRRLQAEEISSLLEIGSGTGQAGLFFQDAGLKVVCTDLSSEMVRLCREKGLEAYEMDFLQLDFADGHFDSVFAQNSLLHVPKADFGEVLREVRRVVKPGGLLFFGMNGGEDFEGVRDEDSYEPKRFYSHYTDETLRSILGKYFEILNFEVRRTEGQNYNGFQAATLRKRH